MEQQREYRYIFLDIDSVYAKMSEIARVLLLKLYSKKGRKAEKIFISNFCPSVNGIFILHCNIFLWDFFWHY